jgi:TonB family protein
MTPNPDVRAVAATPYGAYELQRLAHRYLFIALGISIIIHLCVLCLYYILPEFKGSEIERSLRDTGSRHIIIVPPTIKEPLLPSVGGSTPRIANLKNANPVPVSDSKASPDVEIPTQEALSHAGAVIGDDGVVGGSDQTGVFVDESEEAPPDAFVPVEKPPQITHSAAPEYPPLALKADLQGRVVVRVWVDKQGRPREVRIWSSTNEIFNEAAIDAARKYLFVPAYMNAGPVSVWVSLAFNFKLK